MLGDVIIYLEDMLIGLILLPVAIWAGWFLIQLFRRGNPNNPDQTSDDA